MEKMYPAVKMDDNWGYYLRGNLLLLDPLSLKSFNWNPLGFPGFPRSFAMAGAALQRPEICEEQVRQRGSKEKGPGPLAHFRSRGQGRGKLGNSCENQVALLAQRHRWNLYIWYHEYPCAWSGVWVQGWAQLGDWTCLNHMFPPCRWAATIIWSKTGTWPKQRRILDSQRSPKSNPGKEPTMLWVTVTLMILM